MKSISNYISGGINHTKGDSFHIKEGIFDIEDNIEDNSAIVDKFKTWCIKHRLKIVKSHSDGTFDLRPVKTTLYIDTAPPFPFINKLYCPRGVQLVWGVRELTNFFPKEVSGELSIVCEDMVDFSWFKPGTILNGDISFMDCDNLKYLNVDLGTIKKYGSNISMLSLYKCPKLESMKGFKINVGYFRIIGETSLKEADWDYIDARKIFIDKSSRSSLKGMGSVSFDCKIIIDGELI